MEENSTTEVKPTVEPKEIRVSSSFLYSLFAVVALALLIVCKICANFSVRSSTFYGVMSIFIYVLPFIGAFFSYVARQELKTELWLNIAVLALAIMVL